MTAPTVEEIIARSTGRGADAVLVMAKLCNLPHEHWARLLPMLFARQPNVAGWQLLLHYMWRDSSASVVLAARNDRATLTDWFAYADFRSLRTAFMSECVAPDYPAVQTLFRGGQGSARELALGYSWTPLLAEALHYSDRRRVRRGLPVVIKRQVRAEEISLRLAGPSFETVVIEPGEFAPVALAPQERAKLLKKYISLEAKGDAENARRRALPENEKLSLLLDGYEEGET